MLTGDNPRSGFSWDSSLGAEIFCGEKGLTTEIRGVTQPLGSWGLEVVEKVKKERKIVEKEGERTNERWGKREQSGKRDKGVKDEEGRSDTLAFFL